LLASKQNQLAWSRSRSERKMRTAEVLMNGISAA
jgi:hypothetical protein